MLEKSIIKAYVAYLEHSGIQYNAGNDFSVRFELSNTDVTFIDVMGNQEKITLFNYFGTCYTGIRAAKRVAKVLQENFTEYKIWVDKYTGFEIDVEDEFPFTTIEDLHYRVCRLAMAVDKGAGVGKEMLGDAFER